MKKLTALGIALLALGGLSTASLAGPPPKAYVLHCGLNHDCTGMEYVLLYINSNSKGHVNHKHPRTESCDAPDGLGGTITKNFQQTSEDIEDGQTFYGQIPGMPTCNGGDPGGACPRIGATCGVEIL